MLHFLEIDDEKIEALVHQVAVKQTDKIRTYLNFASMNQLRAFLAITEFSFSSLEPLFSELNNHFWLLDTKEKREQFLKNIATQYGFSCSLSFSLLIYFEWRALTRSGSLKAVAALTDNLFQGSTILQPVQTFWQAVTSYQLAIQEYLPDWLDEFQNPKFFRNP
jgi:hypothetical protein